MYKFSSRVFLGALSLLFASNLVFGIDAEFKNTLMKVDLIKSGEGLYNVDLYTKNKFVEPVKVIKKSDLSYYILLPETKNESVRNVVSGVEIRNISTNVYPYAGADVNNGYVKININTTKPVNFRVNVRSEALMKSAKIQDEYLALDTKKEVEKKEETSSQKKNSESSNAKKNELDSSKKTKKAIKTPQRTIEQVIQEEIERVREENAQIEQEEAEFNLAVQEANNDDVLSNEDISELEQIAQEAQNKAFFAKNTMSVFKNKILTKLAQYNIKLSNFLLVCLAFFLGFLAMVIAFAKRNFKTKSKAKYDFVEKTPNCNFKKVEPEEEIKNDGQYFVFDKNIKQTGFCDPATSAIKRNYELSTYEPELKNKYTRNNQFIKKPQNEYDIIQKILKEDTFIDLPPESFANQVKVKQINNEISAPKVQKPAQAMNSAVPKKQEVKTPIAQQQDEPLVLSSVEIAPSRGFMCVSYNESINLLGYIFDDVFALYNFKAQKLQNYDIKYRLSEKDDKQARFIVKVADTKMLIAVTKKQMVMEVLL